MALRKRVHVRAFTLALILAAAAAPAAAAPTWLAATPLSATGQNAIDPAIVITPNGTVVATWSRNDGTANRIDTSIHEPGGSFTSVAHVSAAGTALATLDQLAAGGNNNVVAVWRRNDGTNERIEYADLPAGSTTFAAGTRITPDAGTSFESNPDVAMDLAGDTFVVFRKSDGSNNLATIATRPAGGTFAIQTISAAGQTIQDPIVAAGAGGDAVAVWTRSDGATDRIQASIRPPGGSFSQGVNISTAGVFSSKPQVAVDKSGNAVAVWVEGTRIATSFRPAGGSFGSPVPISASGQNAADPQIAMDAQGNATAVWSNSTNKLVEASIRPVGGVFQATPDPLSAAGQNAQVPQLAIDPAGDVIVVWKRSDGSKIRIQQSVRPAGSATYSSPTEISAAGQNADLPSVSADANGNAAAIFVRSDGTNNLASVAGYDAAGPVISTLGIPPFGYTTSPTTFSFSATDVWSALASSSWNFGDGGSGAGSPVDHTYAADATYTAKLTLTDAVGNATTASGQITITTPHPTQQPPSNTTPTPAPTPATPTPTTPAPTRLPGACANKKIGSAKADKLIGTALGDLIRGGKGNDVIIGGAGADCLFGQGGNDKLSGGRGNDKLDGGPGNDSLTGGPGKDTFVGGAGNDRINSKDGVAEKVNCGRGRDTVKADRKDKLVGCEVAKRL